jgi:hypothetical protein
MMLLRFKKNYWQAFYRLFSRVIILIFEKTVNSINPKTEAAKQQLLLNGPLRELNENNNNLASLSTDRTDNGT